MLDGSSEGYGRFLPVLIEPVIGLGLGVERVAEVGGARRSDPVLGRIVQQEVVDKLLVATLIILLHDTEASLLCGDGGSYSDRHYKMACEKFCSVMTSCLELILRKHFSSFRSLSCCRSFCQKSRSIVCFDTYQPC